jgi:hypothetical protein
MQKHRDKALPIPRRATTLQPDDIATGRYQVMKKRPPIVAVLFTAAVFPQHPAEIGTPGQMAAHRMAAAGIG